jgi:hypothetical protein
MKKECFTGQSIFLSRSASFSIDLPVSFTRLASFLLVGYTVIPRPVSLLPMLSFSPDEPTFLPGSASFTTVSASFFHGSAFPGLGFVRLPGSVSFFPGQSPSSLGQPDSSLGQLPSLGPHSSSLGQPSSLSHPPSSMGFSPLWPPYFFPGSIILIPLVNLPHSLSQFSFSLDQPPSPLLKPSSPQDQPSSLG